MPTVHFTNLLIVVAAGLVAPLASGFFPRLRLLAIVLEILLGIVIGPSGLGWVKPDLPVSILARVGLAFLLLSPGWRSTSSARAHGSSSSPRSGSPCRSRSRSSFSEGALAQSAGALLVGT